MSDQKLKHRGTLFFMDGNRYIVPGLSLGQLEEFEGDLTKTTEEQESLGLKGRLNLYLPMIGAAIRRNYPEVTDEYLRGSLDVAGYFELLQIVQTGSGMREVVPGE